MSITKKIKFILIILLSITVLAVSALVAIVLIIFPPPISEKAMIKDFQKNRDTIQVVVDYMENSEYANISVYDNSESGMMYAYNDELYHGIPIGRIGGEMKIDDLEVSQAVDYLQKKRGYSTITKDKGYISFQRWADLDEGRGVVYSLDGTRPNLQILTKLVELPEENWYYYEEDYNEWKRLNATNE